MRFGIDLGGTKTEIMALRSDGSVALRRRIATPRDYDTMLRAVAELVRAADAETGSRGSVGMAIPGSESFGSNLIKNANTTYLIGKPLRLDLEKVLKRCGIVELAQRFQSGGDGGHAREGEGG